MGLFFNYDKPGPGVDKNAPKKKGAALFFELSGRYFGKLLLANILYFIVSLPVLALYAVIILNFFGNMLPENVGSVGFAQVVVIMTTLVAILWGTGPASCGYAYILRNLAREEHVFLRSDFFEKIKESFWRGLVFLAVDIVMLVIFSFSILFYQRLSEEVGGIYTAGYIMTGVLIVLYTIIHFYLYEMEVTFQNKIRIIYKNSLLMSFATLPMCLVIGAVIVVLSFLVLRFLTPAAILIVAFLCWISFMRFIIDFYTARVIKKNFLQENKETNE
ncbi:MAG: DUF624 domain-containing protein [Clostridia bacterium]|nr:DUF624 domain-containing protein [Clostridia bacterium]